jgi:hypothetical protein
MSSDDDMDGKGSRGCPAPMCRPWRSDECGLSQGPILSDICDTESGPWPASSLAGLTSHQADSGYGQRPCPNPGEPGETRSAHPSQSRRCSRLVDRCSWLSARALHGCKLWAPAGYLSGSRGRPPGPHLRKAHRPSTKGSTGGSSKRPGRY